MQRRSKTWAMAAVAIALALPACEDGVSTAEVEEAAKAHVRQNFNVSAETPLSVDVFVGRPREGETVLCGTVSAETSTSEFRPQRFVAAVDPMRWLVFEPAHSAMLPSQPDMFAEWANLCTGARGDEGEEPLAPTERGEER